jgi:sugar phosphate isomerase/epimerase
MRSLGIEFISALAMPPVEFVHLVADLGCDHIGMALAPITPNPHNHPAWSLLQDSGLRAATRAALRERGVRVALGEGFLVRAGQDIRASAASLAALVELGAQRINVNSIEPDRNRAIDQLGALVDMAAAAGVETTLEFAPILAIRNLPEAVATVRAVGRPGFRVLIDAMHLVRGGHGAADLAALDPALVGYAQLCDAPAEFTPQGYVHEARCERMVPGAGALPLREIVAALPAGLPLGLEVPQLSLAEAGVDTCTRLERCLAATRALIAQVDSLPRSSR